jgi:hypothetical protein
MANGQKVAQATFLLGLNAAVKTAQETGFIAPIRFTVLADIMQIQCLKSNNTDLLEFTLPEGLSATVSDIVKANGVNLSVLKSDDQDCFVVKFKSDDEQDKFIKLFEMMSFQGKRAYPTPDIYLGKPTVDQQFCIDLLQHFHRLVQSDFGRHSTSQNTVRGSTVMKVHCGAIYLQARVDEHDVFAAPNFEQLEQPTRCYLVEYSSGLFRFFWSKPGEHGDVGTFITNPMGECEPRNGERYFNDADHDDPNQFTAALTLSKEAMLDGAGFLYRQKFSAWVGAFMGSLSPVNMQTIHSDVPSAWRRMFEENSPH